MTSIGGCIRNVGDGGCEIQTVTMTYLRYLRVWSLTTVQDPKSNIVNFLLYLLRLSAVLSVMLLQSSRFNSSMFLQFSAKVLIKVREK